MKNYLIYVFIIIFLFQYTVANELKRVYEIGHQFPIGSQHLEFPPTVTFSIFMGKMKYLKYKFLIRIEL